MGDVSAFHPRTCKVGGGGGGGWLPPLRKVFLIFFLHGKTLAPYVFCSCWSVTMDTRYDVISSRCSSHFPVQPGFHMIVRIVPIALVISKKLETIRTSTRAISGSYTIASTTRDAPGTSAMSLGQTIEFLRVFRKQAKHDADDGF